MTSAGWYPDPAGAPDTYRYWDGHAWSQVTSTDPFGQGGQAGQVRPQPQAPPQPQPEPPPTLATLAPLPPITPQPPPLPYGALPDDPRPQWSPMQAPTAPPSGGSHTGRTIAIGSAAAAFVVLLAIIAVVAVHTLGSGDRPVVAQPVAPSNPEPTDPANPGNPAIPLPSLPGGSLPAALQCYGGITTAQPQRGGAVLSGGGLTAPALKAHGYRPDPSSPLEFSFASNAQGATKTVLPNWASTLVVGALPRGSGFTGLAPAARTVMSCMASNPLLYTGVTGVAPVSAAATTVDGHRAFSLVEDIKVAVPSTTATGDTVQVVVVDTGDKHSYGVFVMVVPIGSTAYLALQKSTVEQLRVK